MEEFTTYSLIDFFPFSADVYLRLFERLNEELWPVPLVALAVGLAAALWAWRRPGDVRPVAVALAVAWVGTGWAFFLERYGELSWVGTYLAQVAFVQAALVLVLGRRLDVEAPRGKVARLGLGLVVWALVVHPLLGPLAFGRPWAGAEVVGLAPDPTTVATLGGALLAREPLALVVLPIPLLWCAASGLTGWALGMPTGLVTAGVGAVVVGALVGRQVQARRQ